MRPPQITTSFENAHGTVFREVLYPWHSWFARRVAVHEAIGKSNDLVFRCTLSGSDADRSEEVPAWMFDRTACAEARLTAGPYVSAAALSALRDLLRHALKDTPASSSGPTSGVSRTSRDQKSKRSPCLSGERNAGSSGCAICRTPRSSSTCLAPIASGS